MAESRDRYLVNSVHSTSSGTLGRSLNSARQHHFVIDSPTPGEALTSSEAFLAGISSCGVNLVERAAHDAGVALRRIEVTIEGLRDREAPANFAGINLRFILTGPSQQEAEALVGRYEAG